jgi:HAD superfamily hydrolase (TIGR01509 family)
MSDDAQLAELLAERSRILLDFDGPVCSIFANHPAPAVADVLRETIRDAGVQVSAEAAVQRDPLEVLRWTATLGAPKVVELVDTRLCAEELDAAQTAAPTQFGREAIIAAREAGKALAIVSNNSAGAVAAYLARYRLGIYGLPVVGRTFARPDLMKPNPEPILRAAKSVGAAPADCVLIGDSLADIVGAQAAGMPVIAYANRPEKVAQFTDAQADTVVTTMADIARVLIDLKL